MIFLEDKKQIEKVQRYIKEFTEDLIKQGPEACRKYMKKILSKEDGYD